MLNVPTVRSLLLPETVILVFWLSFTVDTMLDVILLETVGSEKTLDISLGAKVSSTFDTFAPVKEKSVGPSEGFFIGVGVNDSVSLAALEEKLFSFENVEDSMLVSALLLTEDTF